MPGGVLYTPTVPPNNRFANLDVNALGSHYSSVYGHGATPHIAKVTRDIIYDAAPKQFFDLKILNAKAPKVVNNDEFSYSEYGYGREPILNATIAAPIAAGASQVVPIQNPETVSIDMIIGYPDNSRGTITNIAGNNITITAETGKTLPQIAASAAGAHPFFNLSPVEADGMNSFSQYYRIETIERVNYVQLLLKAQRFGRLELHKYLHSGSPTGSNFISIQKQRMLQQFRIDLSNIFWNGNMAEVTLANGMKAKTARGVFPTLQQAGAPHTTVSLQLAPSALEELALDTEFGSWGDTKFLYGTPRAIFNIAQEYKRDLTRYTPDSDLAKLGLSAVDIGSTKIVFVPTKRFEDESSFPASFKSRLFLLDQAAIQPVVIFGEEMGDTLMRGKGGTRENFMDTYISATTSYEFNNPVCCGWIDLTNLF